MKLYVAITGVIFGIIVVAHVLRIATENRHLASDPVFLLLTLVAAALSIWSGVLLARRSRF